MIEGVDYILVELEDLTDPEIETEYSMMSAALKCKPGIQLLFTHAAYAWFLNHKPQLSDQIKGMLRQAFWAVDDQLFNTQVRTYRGVEMWVLYRASGNSPVRKPRPVRIPR